MRPRLLDLFCGAGGAAVGYHRAGWDVIGVDIAPQPDYPYQFIEIDALTVPVSFISHFFAAVHASPPCQRYIRSGLVDRERHPDLLPAARELLEQTGLPWVIENVPGAPMRPDAVLCGSMFGLAVRRHRWFEFSWTEPLPVPPCDHSQPIAGVYGNAHGRSGAYDGMLPSDLVTWSWAMGIDWMSTAELADAIPPAYTELIGHQLLQQIRVAA